MANKYNKIRVNEALVSQANFDEFCNYWYPTPIENIDTEKVMKLLGTGLPANLLAMLKNKKAFNSMSEDDAEHKFYQPVVRILKAAPKSKKAKESQVVKPQVAKSKPKPKMPKSKKGDK